MSPITRCPLLPLLFLGWSSLPAQEQEPPREVPESEQDELAEVPVPSIIDDFRIDIRELLAQVAEADGREFVIDPRVGGHSYVVTPAEATFELLQAVLRVHGYAAVASGERVFVIPDANVRAMPTRVLMTDDESIPDDEVVSRVLEVNVENAMMLVPLLRPLLPQAAHLVAMGNKLLIVDRYDNVRRVVAIAQALGE